MNIDNVEKIANQIMSGIGYIVTCENKGKFIIRKEYDGRYIPFITVMFHKMYFNNAEELKSEYVHINVIRAINYLEHAIEMDKMWGNEDGHTTDHYNDFYTEMNNMMYHDYVKDIRKSSGNE